MNRLAVGVAAACATVALAGTACGQPQYHYVKDSDRHLFFKVPRDWPRLNQQELNQAEDRVAGSTGPETAKIVRSLVWSIAYEDSDDPKLQRIFGSEALQGPLVYSKVRRLPESQRSSVSLDALRNIYLPVTAEARLARIAAGTPLRGFVLHKDEVLDLGDGLRGVHVQYGYLVDAQQQTFDVTALANKDASRVYHLVVQCSAKCFAERRQEIDEIVASFTVRESR
jgi:hypothetical protein